MWVSDIQKFPQDSRFNFDRYAWRGESDPSITAVGDLVLENSDGGRKQLRSVQYGIYDVLTGKECPDFDYLIAGLVESDWGSCKKAESVLRKVVNKFQFTDSGESLAGIKRLYDCFRVMKYYGDIEVRDREVAACGVSILYVVYTERIGVKLSDMCSEIVQNTGCNVNEDEVFDFTLDFRSGVEKDVFRLLCSSEDNLSALYKD